MKYFLSIFFCLLQIGVFAQATKNANVYPSNLEENMYYEKFNAATNTIEGLYFMVLSDGNNSKDKTPSFEVSLYLIPVNNMTKEAIVIVKKYSLAGIYHMGSHEFKKENISVNDIKGLKPGTYRLGVWVNANENFDENKDDNAMLFKGEINITGIVENKIVEKKVEEEVMDEGDEEGKDEGDEEGKDEEDGEKEEDE